MYLTLFDTRRVTENSQPGRRAPYNVQRGRACFLSPRRYNGSGSRTAEENLQAQSTLDARTQNLPAIPLMLLVSSVNTPICNSRFHSLAFAPARSVWIGSRGGVAPKVA